MVYCMSIMAHEHFSLESLDLTHDQINKIEKVLKNYRYERRNSEQKVIILEQKQMILFNQILFNSQEFERIEEEKNRLRSHVQTQFYLQLHPLLTPEQRKKLSWNHSKERHDKW